MLSTVSVSLSFSEAEEGLADDETGHKMTTLTPALHCNDYCEWQMISDLLNMLEY